MIPHVLFDPCGRVVDMLRSAYSTKMVFEEGGEQILVRWYDAAPGARAAPPSPFWSRNWKPNDPPDYTVGEVEGAPRNWCDGSAPAPIGNGCYGFPSDPPLFGFSLGPTEWQAGLVVGGNMGDGRMTTCYEGMPWFLRRLTGQDAGNFDGLFAALVAIGVGASKETVWADLTEKSFSGYARQPLANWSVPTFSPAYGWFIDCDPLGFDNDSDDTQTFSFAVIALDPTPKLVAYIELPGTPTDGQLPPHSSGVTGFRFVPT